MNKASKITVITIGSLIGIIVILLLIVRICGGSIAQSIVEKNDTSWLHREITMDKPTINPFNTSLRLTNVCLYEEDGVNEFVRFDTLYVQVNPFKLIRKEIFLKHMWLKGLDATIINQDSCFNFQDMIDHFASDDEEVDEEEESASSWGIALKDIQIHRGRITYLDTKRASDFTMQNINIDVPEVHLGKDQTEAGLSFEFPNNQGSMHLMAHVDQESGAYEAQVGLDAIGLDIALPYVKEYAHISQLGSRLSGKIQAQGELQAITQSSINGHLTLENTNILDEEKQQVLSLKRFYVELESIDIDKMKLVLNEVSASDLYTTYEQWEGESTLSKLLKQGNGADEGNGEGESEGESEATASPANATESSTPLDFLIKKVDISNINLLYMDHTLMSPFHYSITGLSINSNNLSLHGKNDIRLKARLNQTGSLEASWKGGLNLHEGQETLSLTVRNLQLADFSPWSEAYTATPLTGGSMSLMAEERLNNGMLRGTNKVDIYGMSAGKKIIPSNAPYKTLPIKLAIGVLEDLDHKIEISLPISGDINNPQFSLSKIIWKTVGNVLLKATASPWVALGKAMGVGKDDLEKIAISTRQADFTSEQYNKVDQLVEMMRQEEELTLCLTQQFNMATAIAEQREFAMKRRYYEHKYGSIEMPTLADIEDIRSIKTTSKEYKTWLAKQDLTTIAEADVQADVMRFAEIRRRVLEDYLIKQQGLPEDRIKVQTSTDDILMSYKGNPQFAITSEVISLEPIEEPEVVEE